MTKLNASQIQELYSFTRKHYVEHYDLQTELVDHLANGIEEQMLLHPNISFKEALSLEFKKFGVHGFENIILKRKNAMALRYGKIIFSFFKSYFSIPKIIISITLIATLTFIFNKVTANYKQNLYVYILYFIVVLLFVFTYINQKKYKSEILKDTKKWMLKEQIYSLVTYVNVVNLLAIVINSSLNIVVFKDFLGAIIYVDFFFAALISCLFILSYIIAFVIPSKAEELLLKTYPEYNII